MPEAEFWQQATDLGVEHLGHYHGAQQVKDEKGEEDGTRDRIRNGLKFQAKNLVNLKSHGAGKTEAIAWNRHHWRLVLFTMGEELWPGSFARRNHQ